jgi:probable rRNA maturation factor
MAAFVFVADEQSQRTVDLARWARLAEAVLADEGVTGDAELSVLFVDEQSMAELNRRFAGEDGPTDVLAFPIDEEPPESGRWPDAGGPGPGSAPPEPADLPRLIGDVVICPEVAWRNSIEDGGGAAGEGAPERPPQEGAYQDELALLLVHGILHLQGMEHESEEDARAMRRRQQELLERHHRPGGQGLADPGGR